MIAPERSRTLGPDPRVWSATHTYGVGRLDVAALTDLKASTAVSVVIPARDESATIGPIVRSILTAHVEGSGLVDEVIVIDSDSTDGTPLVASVAGAVVHASRDIRADLEWRPGKGEAMWKSLHVASGDLIVFIDGDLTSFSPDFVTGLVAPLLLDQDVSLVKGFYDRDLDGASEGRGQGGRVTELVARPLINLWWPQLARVFQPLGGEWSARRALLEQLRFPCGYGVELAILVDVYQALGLDAIAQVDLGHRRHLHQDLASLGAMAAEVVAAATQRRFGFTGPDDPFLAHPVRTAQDEMPQWRAREINLAERPPIVDRWGPADAVTDWSTAACR